MTELSDRLEKMSPLQRAIFALKQTQAQLAELQQKPAVTHEPIAIVGMACRFPQVQSLDEFWSLLAGGVDAITEVPASRWNADAFYDSDPATPGKIVNRKGGFLANAGGFDNQFFGISDREAIVIDPQQRLLLELAWEALEHAGIPASTFRGSTAGVFVGIGVAEYAAKIICDSTAGNPFTSTGNALCVAANRISHALDLRGPSFAIDTACSSSLVAIHQACQSLRSDNLPLAIVGGVNLLVNPLTSINLTKAGVCSPEGRVKSFDASANGYVRSDGAGVLVLKRLSDAIANGDKIRATILGSAINHNGASNGLSAPRGETQEAVLRAAYQQANLSPGQVDYVETQGTATPIGDAIEANVLGKVMADSRPPGSVCRIGSVKTNLGHTETASGMASVIKIALSMQHGELPASLHYNSPNPNINFDSLPIAVQAQHQAWPTNADGLRIAGVSGFGFGGANAHVVLQSNQAVKNTSVQPVVTDISKWSLLISAKSQEALAESAIQYCTLLTSMSNNVAWQDVCWTAANRRELLGYRLLITASSQSGAAAHLQTWTDGGFVDTDFVKSQKNLPLDQAKIPEALLGDSFVDLPTYAWQHQQFWIDGPALPDALLMPSQRSHTAGIEQDIEASSANAIQARPQLDIKYAPATNDLEATLVEHWQTLLKIERVGIDDNFFQLGGHSLLAAQIVSRLDPTLVASLPLRVMFESPTIRQMAAEIIARSQDNKADDALPPIVRGDNRDVAPLSLAQEALWFLDRLAPSSGAYTTFPTLRVHGPLDVDVLRQSLDAVISRHEILRTTFPQFDGEPVQSVALEQSIQLQHDVLDDEQAVLPWLQQHMQSGIDLQKGPLVAVHVGRLDANEHIILVAWHHIIHDGWSGGVLAREIIAVYEAISKGQPIELPELPVQYADWARWQRDLLSGERLQRLSDYWSTQLQDLPTLDLVTDYPRPAVRGTLGASVACNSSPELSAAVNQFARDNAVTPFMVFLAAFNATLARFSGQKDFAIGSPVANRRQPEVEGLIGYFINMLVLRTDQSELKNFGELVQATKATVLDAFEHQDMTLDQVVNVVNPPRDTSRHPLFQAMFVLQNNAPLSTGDVGLTFEPYTALPVHSSYFDLNLDLQETDRGFVGHLIYNRSLFSEATATRLSDSMLALLASAIANPQQDVSSLQLSSKLELQQLKKFSQPEQPIELAATQTTLHAEFEAQVARTPGKIALQHERTQLTYRELNDQAEKFAADLRLQNVAPGDLVAVDLERSIELVVAIFGILKAGAGYLPLDRAAPKIRNEQTLADSQARFVVTKQQPTALAAGVASNGLVIVQRIAEPAARSMPLTNSTAYVIYTSGSTGKPKGVVISHAAAMAYVIAARDVYQINADDRVLQFASISFDAHVEELFISLLTGATLVLRTDAMLNSIAEFVQRCDDYEISVLSLPTGFWHELVYELQVSNKPLPNALRLIVIGGEAALTERVAAWFEMATERVRLINSYGPTETTVVATTLELKKQDAFAQRLSIGRPLNNTTAYVLDPHRKPVPIGVRGELYLGGLSLADGYLHADELTRQRFVELPLGDDPVRLYRTGDIVSWKADGSLEFFGRDDHQIKLRGFRIELSEIEAELRTYAGVTQAVVIAVRLENAELQLAAYVLPDSSADLLTVEALRQFLSAKLPPHMVPARVMIVDRIPTTTSGKIDRAALPAIDWNGVQESVQFVAPENETQRQVAALFANVLAIDAAEEIGATDDFFALGGNSLLALRLVAKLRDRLNVDVPMVTLFSSPTVRELSSYILQSQAGGVLPAATMVSLANTQSGTPLSFGQQRFWFLQKLNPGSSAYNMHAAVEINGELDIERLEQTIAAITQRHESLRTQFADNDGEPVQIVAQEIQIPILQRDLDGSKAQVQQFALEIASSVFDLERGPLLKVGLAKISAKQHVLVVATHHIVFDGWSMQVLIGEVAAIYDALSRGFAHALPTPKFQYRDFAAWQRDYLTGETLENLQAFWKTRLDGVTPLLLPTDKLREGSRREGARHSFTLPKTLSIALQKFSREQGVTLFMTLLSTLEILLQRYTRQSDIAVATPVSGRGRGETQQMIGFFVNTLILRNEVEPQTSFLEFLQQVRSQTIEAYEHQDLPFDQVVAALKPKRSIDRHPFAQVMLNMLQTLPTDAQAINPARGVGELQIRPLDGGEVQHNAEFDLMLNVQESDSQIECWWGYDAAVMEESSMARMADQFESLLQSIVATPERPIADLNAIPAQQRDELLNRFNVTTQPFPHDRCLHELVVEQAERTPDNVAIEFAGRELTYAQLLDRSAWLAAKIQAATKHSNAEPLIPMFLDRSPDAVVAMLAILRAGFGFVPLDPNMPLDRLRKIADDLGATVCISQSKDAAKFERLGFKVISSSTELDGLVASSNTRVNSTKPSDLAYAIYTSGSTGQPKGVLIEHRSVVNVVTSFIRTYDVTESDRVLQNTSLSFDVSINEIFPALCCGATLVQPTVQERLEIDGLASYVDEHAITIVAAAPTVLARMNAARTDLPTLRLILSGGETLRFEDIDFLANHSTITNGYGPTETTICATSFNLLGQSDEYQGVVSIGKPLANYTVYVLDECQRLLPRGCPGELCIGGVGLARGYLNDEAKTRRSFIPHPFIDGERVYRTGDLVRWLPDATLAFLGRIDRQVKIRGFRIELGEIEAALLSDPSVNECAVVDVEVQNDRRLVAYVVCGEPTAVTDAARLRKFAAQRLPEYMVPSMVMVLDALPLTSSGKVDRNKLPAAKFEASTKTLIAPRTDIEKGLAVLWQSLLGVERVGVTDNFFDLGGHSLLVVKIGSHIASTYKVDIPIAAVFADPTIATVATQIQSQLDIAHYQLAARDSSSAKLSDVLVDLRRGTSDEPPLFCIHGLGGHIVNFIPLTRELLSDRAVIGVQGLGTDGRFEPHNNLYTMAAFYCDAILQRQTSGPYQLLGWSMGGLLAMEIGRRLMDAGHEVLPLVLLDTHLSLKDRSLEEVTEESVIKQIAPRLGLSLPRLKKQTIQEQWDMILEASQLAGGSPTGESGAAEIHRLAIVCKAHLQAIASYEVRAYPGELILLQAARPYRWIDRRWKGLCKKFTGYKVAGSHYSMLAKPDVQLLAEKLEELLAAMAQSSGARL